MGQVTLCGDCVSGATVVSNRFIDIYMGNANDAQIKIYLYLLRCVGGNMPVSVPIIADFFNYTEKDVLRALKYWDKQKLLKLSFNENKQLLGIRLLPVNELSEVSRMPDESFMIETETEERTEAKVFKLPAKPNYSVDKLLSFKERPDISQMLFVVEQYLKKTLNSNEISSFLYMYDCLGFDSDLMEYLVEYCVTNKKRSIHYIETVANSWAASGIRYVEEAKEYTSNVPGEIYEVFKAFGIQTSRNPVETELAYVRKWKSLGFKMALIVEACTRTVMAIHNPSFEYADKILTNWNKEGVTCMSDVEALDAKYRESAPKQTKDRMTGEKREKTTGNTNNKFNNFNQRSYDFSELEKEAYTN